jgi:predicted HNH restriction endonuclease
VTSQRKGVYNTRRWKGPTRVSVLARAGGYCQYAGCRLVDTTYGGTTRMQVHHTNDLADPFDETYLVCICPRHHGILDGPKARRGKVRRLDS